MTGTDRTGTYVESWLHLRTTWFYDVNPESSLIPGMGWRCTCVLFLNSFTNFLSLSTVPVASFYCILHSNTVGCEYEKGDRKLIVTEIITKRFINIQVIIRKSPHNKISIYTAELGGQSPPGTKYQVSRMYS